MAAIARGAGSPHVADVKTVYDFLEAGAEAFERDEFSTFVARVDAVGPDHFGMELMLAENSFRFYRHIQERMKGR